MKQKNRMYYFSIAITILLLSAMIFIYVDLTKISTELLLDSQKHQSELREEINEKSTLIDLLESEIKDLKDKINDIANRLEASERNLYFNNSMSRGHETSIQNLMKIVENLPQLTHKLAFINHESIKDSSIDLSLDYVEMLSGEEAFKAAKEDNDEYAGSLSNNFYIRNKEIENHIVRITDDTLIYVLEGAALKLANFLSFVDISDSFTNRLFHVYSIGNKILILEEQY